MAVVFAAFGAWAAPAMAAASLSATPTTVAPGATVTVSWSGVSSPTTTDWIGVYTPGAASSAYGNWLYDDTCAQTAGTSSLSSGSCSISMPTTSGTYELRLLAKNGYTVLAISGQITVQAATSSPSPSPSPSPSSTPTLSLTPSSVAPGGTLTVSWSGITSPSVADWVGLYTPGSASSAYLDWFYDSSCTKSAGSSAEASGSCSYTVPSTLASGTYELRLQANNGYTVLATSSQFTVGSSVAPPVNTALPAISGQTSQGATLTATTGSWTNSPSSYAYQWQRCDTSGSSCQDVQGASAQTYMVVAADVGSTLRVVVTAKNAAGSASATSDATGAIGASSAPATGSSAPVVVAVGDIACAPGDTQDPCQQAQTAALAAAQNPDDVLVLGDNQYESGLLSEYEGAGAYNATWGVFNPIVQPVPGNHEYAMSSTAAGYFQYFGAAAHASPGYYSYNVGTWHIVALNSNCSSKGCSDLLAGTTSSAQTAWLQADLASNPKACTLAYWHHPLFSSGWVGDSPGVRPLWNALYNAHADIVLDGHDHLYERYARQNPSGQQTAAGIREFVVGTGGEYLMPLTNREPGLEVADTTDFGVLVLTLHATSYDWAFKRLDGTVVDSGTTACHGSATATAARALTVAPAPRRPEPALSFSARPLPVSVATAEHHGLPIAIHCSRACDVTVGVWVSQDGRTRRVATFYETESQIPKPYSRIALRLPARGLAGRGAIRLILRLNAEDAAGHHRRLVTTVSLPRR